MMTQRWSWIWRSVTQSSLSSRPCILLAAPLQLSLTSTRFPDPCLLGKKPTLLWILCPSRKRNLKVLPGNCRQYRLLPENYPKMQSKTSWLCWPVVAKCPQILKKNFLSMSVMLLPRPQLHFRHLKFAGWRMNLLLPTTEKTSNFMGIFIENNLFWTLTKAKSPFFSLDIVVDSATSTKWFQILCAGLVLLASLYHKFFFFGPLVLHHVIPSNNPFSPKSTEDLGLMFKLKSPKMVGIIAISKYDNVGELLVDGLSAKRQQKTVSQTYCGWTNFLAK